VLLARSSKPCARPPCMRAQVMPPHMAGCGVRWRPPCTHPTRVAPCACVCRRLREQHAQQPAA
jgi:hypothetical protein